MTDPRNVTMGARSAHAAVVNSNPTPATPEAEPCVHLLAPGTCSWCKRAHRPARTFPQVTGNARADALYERQSARPIDRRSPPRGYSATPWSGYRGKRPVVNPFYRRLGVRV